MILTTSIGDHSTGIAASGSMTRTETFQEHFLPILVKKVLSLENASVNEILFSLDHRFGQMGTLR
jgi:hypothetical protein